MTTAVVEPAAPTDGDRRGSARARILAWLLWGWAAIEATLLAGALLLFPTLRGDDPAVVVELAVFLLTLAVAAMAFATAGLLVTLQQARNAVGWTMLGGGAALGAVFVGYAVGVAIIESDPLLGGWFVLLGVVLFGPALYLLGPGLASVFPDGRPLPGWWARAAWLASAGIVIGSVLAAVAPGPLEESIDVANPLASAALPSWLRDGANAVTGLALVAGGIIGVASLVARFRRANSETRRQLKWFLFAVAVWALLLPISLVVGDTWTAIAAILALALVPAAVVVAIRRHRLYEIDVLINRTLVYVPLVGIVAGLFAGLTALIQRVFNAVTGNESDAAAVISALALAAVFTPMRNAIQAAVDRRWKPESANAAGKWDDPDFRAAVEAIVRDVTGTRS